MGLPTPGSAFVGAKYFLVFLWIMGVTLFVFVIGLGVGTVVNIQGWSAGLLWASLGRLLAI